MVKKNRGDSTDIKTANEWLRRFEEDSESPPQIASLTGADVRTVRKQIKRARDERERKESKQLVYGRALEKHYADLCAFARKMKTNVSKDVPVSLSSALRNDPMYRALKEHLPMLRLWKDIEKLQLLETDYEQAIEKLKERVRQEAQLKTSLGYVSSSGKPGLYNDGLVNAITFHVQAQGRSLHGLENIDYRELETLEGVRVERGAFALGLVPREKVELLKNSFDSMIKDAPEWEEYIVLFKLTSEFMQIHKRIDEELLRIILRRVVPGNCVYCPF